VLESQAVIGAHAVVAPLSVFNVTLSEDEESPIALVLMFAMIFPTVMPHVLVPVTQPRPCDAAYLAASWTA